MSEHFERHRGDAERLVTLAATEGMTLTPERAYRAWSRYSDSMAAGWMTLGDDEDITKAILAGEVRSLEVEDIGAAVVHRDDVETLVGKCAEDCLELGRDDIVSAWSDHSAARGRNWIHIDWRNVDEALQVLRQIEPGSAPVAFGRG